VASFAGEAIGSADLRLVAARTLGGVVGVGGASRRWQRPSRIGLGFRMSVGKKAARLT